MNPTLIMYLMMMAGCATQQQTSTSTSAGNYSEDISAWRPTFEVPKDSSASAARDTREKPYVESRYAVNKQLDVVLDSIDRINLSRKYVEGFTIQIYAGLNKDEAMNIKKKFSLDLPDLESEMIYAQPNFRVKTGKYFTRMDAQKDFIAIKKYFTNAIIIPDRIKILE